MLRELAVQNLALIEDVRVELHPGFCAWTGETGAGKSLLLGALGLLLGERGSADLIRTGTDELRVTGRFDLARRDLRRQVEAVVEGGLEEDDVILSRRLTRAGRSHCYVNEQPVALATLRRIGEVLVDIHGQRENQSLLEPTYQLELLDAFGNLGELRQKYLDAAARLRGLRSRHAKLNAERRQRQRDLDLLRFERDELDRAAIKPGELPELTVERDRLSHAQALQAFAGGGYSVLYDDEGSVVERVGKLQREAESWSKVDPALTEVAQRLHAVSDEVRDAAETLRDLAERYEADPVRQEEVEKRLALLKRLEVKYGRPADELIAYRADLDGQEARLQGDEEDL